jgi:hypothetical protein
VRPSAFEPWQVEKMRNIVDALAGNLDITIYRALTPTGSGTTPPTETVSESKWVTTT